MSRNVPWLSEQALVDVAHQLFPTNGASDDVTTANKETAIATISTWRLRITDTIPEFLPIEATAELTAALLIHIKLRGLAKITPSIDFAIRAAYSHAISRFVSTICDRYHPQNKGMDTLAAARFLGLPEYLVDLRHAIVHRKEPTFVELERAAKDCLSWLKARQWEAILTMIDQGVGSVGPPSDAAQRATDIIDAYIVNRKAEIRAGVGTESITQVSFAAGQQWLQANSTMSGVAAMSSTLPIFLQSLFMSRRFWPKQVNDATMTSAFAIWNPLLMSVVGSPEPTNVSLLLQSFLDQLSKPSDVVAFQDPAAHAIYYWITWMLNSAESTGPDSRKTSQSKSASPWTPFIIAEHLDLVECHCILHPGYWTDKLYQDIPRSWSQQDTIDGANLVENSAVTATTPALETVALREATSQIESSAAQVVEETNATLAKRQSLQSNCRGWKLQTGPVVSRPIGVSHTEALSTLVNR